MDTSVQFPGASSPQICSSMRSKEAHLQELDRAHFKVLEAMAMVTRTRRNVPFGSGTHERLKRVEAALGSVRQELEFEFHSLEQNGYGEKRVQGYAALQRAALAAEVRG